MLEQCLIDAYNSLFNTQISEGDLSILDSLSDSDRNRVESLASELFLASQRLYLNNLFEEVGKLKLNEIYLGLTGRNMTSVVIDEYSDKYQACKEYLESSTPLSETWVAEANSRGFATLDDFANTVVARGDFLFAKRSEFLGLLATFRVKLEALFNAGNLDEVESLLITVRDDYDFSKPEVYNHLDVLLERL